MDVSETYTRELRTLRFGLTLCKSWCSTRQDAMVQSAKIHGTETLAQCEG